MIEVTQRSVSLPKAKNNKPGFLAAYFGNSTVIIRVMGFIILFLIVWVMVQPFIIVQMMKQDERVIVLDSNGPTYSITPLLNFEEANELHEQVTRDAIGALFSRSPSGPDRQDIINMVFLKDAREKLAALFESENNEFRTKNFHQKANAAIKRITPSDKAVIVLIEGQLIRTGVYQQRPLVETKKFNLQLTLLRNPNMMVNKRYPLSVWAFDLQYL